MSSIPVGFVLLAGFVACLILAGLVNYILLKLIGDLISNKSILVVLGSLVWFFSFFFVVFPNVVILYEDTETTKTLFIKSWLTLAIVIIGNNLFYGLAKIGSKLFIQKKTRFIGFEEAEASTSSQRFIKRAFLASYLTSSAYLIFLIWSKI
jgi:hypothetical protein